MLPEEVKEERLEGFWGKAACVIVGSVLDEGIVGKDVGDVSESGSIESFVEDASQQEERLQWCEGGRRRRHAPIPNSTKPEGIVSPR